MEASFTATTATTTSFSTTISKLPINFAKTTSSSLNLLPSITIFKCKKNTPHCLSTCNSGSIPDCLFVPSSPFPHSPISTVPPSRRTAAAASTTTEPSTFNPPSSSTGGTRHWMVIMERPNFSSKPEIVDHYVKTLQTVLGSETDAQMCIYDASWDTHFGFCCDIDEGTAQELTRLPGVLCVRPDSDINSTEKDYNFQIVSLSNAISDGLLFPSGYTQHWLVRIDKPAIGAVTKAQMVDCYTELLTKLMGNKKDAQMCIYHVSWKSNFGFCCELDEECARELSGVRGVLSVQPDENFESDDKDYGGESSLPFLGSEGSAVQNQPTHVKTKKLFVTGLSFYTSEKTLRAAFETFGEIVEVKIIMDKISKRSKGFAFVEFTTEEAASAALNEMNGKIINGWMITVDVAKSSPPRYSKVRPGAGR